MSFLLYPSRERTILRDTQPLLWQLGSYLALFQRPEHGTTGALLARPLDGDGEVLIHQLPTHSVPRDGTSAFFHEEWRRATRLSHPHILRTLDVWLDTPPEQEGGGAPRPLFFQLVTEYVPGETLSTVLAALEQKGALMPVPLALDVAARVAEALHAAHEAVDIQGRPLGVLHQDVAPAHVLLAYDGTVKLGGFGIARAAIRMMPGPIFKHVASQPPEAQRKGGGAVDRRADVYGLGVTLYEALTGLDPFRRASDFDSLKAAQSADAPPPSRHRPELSAEVDAVVMRAMAPRPEDRYATAEELGRALEALRAAFPPGHPREDVAAFLRGLFDAERIQSRTRVPSLEELKARVAAASALEKLPAPEPEAEPEKPTAPQTRFVPHSRLLVLYGGALMLVLSAVLTRVARSRESFVEEVSAVARDGRARAASCLEGAGGGPVPVQLMLDGTGRADARVEGPLAGTVAGRCIEEALAGLPYPKKRGLPVTVEVAAGEP